MAVTTKGSVACTQTISSAFGAGDTRPRDMILQNVGTTYNVFVHWDTAEVDKGVRLAPGESITTKDFPAEWKNAAGFGELTAICDTGETTTLLWSL